MHEVKITRNYLRNNLTEVGNKNIPYENVTLSEAKRHPQKTVICSSIIAGLSMIHAYTVA